VVQKTNNMERKTKSTFKLKSGNKPSIAKIAGISPMKELSKSDKESIKRRQEMEANADKKIKSGELKPLSDEIVKKRNYRDTDKLNYYKFGDTIISRRK